MPVPELRVSFADRAELEHELDANFKHGRAFAKQAEGVAVLADCVLLLVHPDDDAALALPAQAVMICESGPMRGIGLQLRPFDAEVVARIESFVAGVREPILEHAAAPADASDAAAAGGDLGPEPAPAIEPARDPDCAAAEGPSACEATGDDDAGDDDAGLDDNAAPDAPSSVDVQALPARNERMRKLSVTEQQKIARSGDLNDRVTLERIYGKTVWEGLLHNPKLTVPEVARIARKGTMPRPLLEFIVENNAWIQAPIVRRALLGNPRVSSEAILKLLRITPKHELRSIYKTSTYSAQVRECARKVLDS